MRLLSLLFALSLTIACGEDEAGAPVDTPTPPDSPAERGPAERDGPAPPPSAMGEESGSFRNVGLQLFDPDALEGPSARLLFDRAPGHATDEEIQVRWLPAGDESRAVSGEATFESEMEMFATPRLSRGQLGRFESIDIVLQGTHDGETVEERFRFPVSTAGRDDPNSPVYLGERVEPGEATAEPGAESATGE